jgi:molybdopterin/thiamine biosynthesis adenylyltransferase
MVPAANRLIIDPARPAAISAPAASGRPAPIRVDPNAPEADDRFQRFRLIGWWDQEKLRAAKVLVVGAGALGNEIIKNLALLGVGNVLIADLDRIENSNLSRSALYRASDNGKFKADVAAAAARDIYPDAKTHAFVGNVVYDLGMGVFRWADVVIGGLDNREARLAINRACWRVGRPWIDGAIEQISGAARVFVPDAAGEAPCYECTMSETDWKLLQFRRSCNLLTRGEMETGGRTPTTPTVSSIIAGVQCQEAVKLIHGLDVIAGKSWTFNGLSAESYTVDFQRKETCYSHEPLEDVVALDASVDTMTAGALLAEARQRLGPAAELEFGRDILEKLVCPKCKGEELMYTSMGKVKADKAVCPTCAGDTRRDVVTFYKLRGTEPAALLARTLAGIGVPPFDIVIARGSGRVIGLELSADAPAVLGPMAPAGGEELEWA